MLAACCPWVSVGGEYILHGLCPDLRQMLTVLLGLGCTSLGARLNITNPLQVKAMIFALVNMVCLEGRTLSLLFLIY